MSELSKEMREQLAMERKAGIAAVGRLTQDVEQLRAELDEAGTKAIELKIDGDSLHNQLLITQQERDEANTYISLLREAVIGGDYLAAKLLCNVPFESSLQAHDNELIERCAAKANRRLRGIDCHCSGYNKAASEIEEAIRSLKGESGE